MIECILISSFIILTLVGGMRLRENWTHFQILSRTQIDFHSWLMRGLKDATVRYARRWEEPSWTMHGGSLSSTVNHQVSGNTRLLREGGLFIALVAASTGLVGRRPEIGAVLFALLSAMTFFGALLYKKLITLRRRALVARIIPDFLRSIRTADGLTSTELISHAVRAWTRRPEAHAMYHPLQSTAWYAATGHSWSHALSTVCSELSDCIPLPVTVGFKRGLDSTNHEARKFMDEAELVAGSQFERMLDVWMAQVIQVIHASSAVCMAAFVGWVLL